MASLTDLYDYLEGKKDTEHIENMFPLSGLTPEEQSRARYEIVTWWSIDRIVKDENFVLDKTDAVAYFSARLNTTNNKLLKYRYGYFVFLLTNDNRYGQQTIDALIECIQDLLPEDRDDYPHQAEDAIEILMGLSKRIKYRTDDVADILWKILGSDYGYRTKMVIIRNAKDIGFFPINDAEKMVVLCKTLFPQTKNSWRESCCEAGIHYANKLQKQGISYHDFFYESLGDMEMEHVAVPETDPKNIAIPHMNDAHLEKAMLFYQEAGAKEKRKGAEKAYRENKKKLIYPVFRFETKTNEQVLRYFLSLKKELLEGNISWMMANLSLPARFIFPSLRLIKERMPDNCQTAELLGFVNKKKDINGNTQNADDDFDVWQKYDIWLMNLVRNHILDLILAAVHTKQLTYAKLKRWFLKSTFFGLPIEYARANKLVTATWFSQIDYGVEVLIKQYQRYLQGKETDWRIPIDLLSIRFEGILRDMIGDYGGHTTRVGKDSGTSQVLLDSLLHEPCLLDAFKAEDIEFFEYVFTAKGHNIRNNVAHAFYIPQDYGIIQATLVFLCILRLTTFRPNDRTEEADSVV